MGAFNGCAHVTAAIGKISDPHTRNRNGNKRSIPKRRIPEPLYALVGGGKDIVATVRSLTVAVR